MSRPEAGRTALFTEHLAAGARMVPFAGWEMPVQYGGVMAEVRSVREACGVFDVSHMGQLDVTGAGCGEGLDAVVSAPWAGVAPQRVAYALLLNEQGGVIDDVMGYHLGPSQWLVVVNASRADVDEAHLRRHLPSLKIANRFDDQSMLAIQGPQAREKVLALANDQSVVEGMAWRDCRPVTLCGVTGLLARGGYTGSDGFEFMSSAAGGVTVWRALLEQGTVPCGLGARDVLRLEAGLPLYGHELREDWTPFQSGCGWAVGLDKANFVGKAALTGREKPASAIKALKLLDNAVPREGYSVQQDGQLIGEVTSGTLSPTVSAGIALAMLPAGLAVDEKVTVTIRGKPHPAQVVKRPFVAHTR